MILGVISYPYTAWMLIQPVYVSDQYPAYCGRLLVRCNVIPEIGWGLGICVHSGPLLSELNKKWKWVSPELLCCQKTICKMETDQALYTYASALVSLYHYVIRRLFSIHVSLGIVVPIWLVANGDNFIINDIAIFAPVHRGWSLQVICHLARWNVWQT